MGKLDTVVQSSNTFWDMLVQTTKQGLDEFVHFSKNVLGTEIATGDVLYCLEEVEIPKREVSTVVNAERLLGKSLAKHFSTVGGRRVVDKALNIRISIDIENQIGIVCQLVKDLNPKRLMSLVGSLVFLSQRVYSERLILTIMGTKAERNDPIVLELLEIMDRLKVTTCYVTMV
jgi:hypothetical protein